MAAVLPNRYFGAWQAREDARKLRDVDDAAIPAILMGVFARVAAFAPGGRLARHISQFNAVVIIGDTVFAHAGISPAYVDVILSNKLNIGMQDWMAGRVTNASQLVEKVIADVDGVMWTRRYAWSPLMAEGACDELAATLQRLGVKRLVVGHSVQRQGATAACDGKVIRIDIGLSSFFSGEDFRDVRQVLEITPDGYRVINDDKSTVSPNELLLAALDENSLPLKRSIMEQRALEDADNPNHDMLLTT